jgi:hypothetical protein
MQKGPISDVRSDTKYCVVCRSLVLVRGRVGRQEILTFEPANKFLKNSDLIRRLNRHPGRDAAALTGVTDTRQSHLRLEDNQRVTYTYTVSADVTGLLSV